MRWRGALALSILLGLPGVAEAAGEGTAPSSSATNDGARSAEIAGLEARIDHDAQALATEGCAVACQALGSMRRSVERLCELERGPRCASARGKVREAEDRVRSACPECSVAGDLTPPVVRANVSDKPAPPAPSSDVEASVVRHGGCAGCVIGGGASEGAGLCALALAVGLAAARRSRRQSPGG